jgi:pimeloyl-ACP methyl ester carboxylesterase
MMQRFSHNGAALAYRAAGTGPPVLFLHNGGASSTIWRHQEAALAERFRTVVVDLPGFGSAPLAQPRLDLAGHVRLVAALADELELRGALVVGNCMGSAIAAGLAQSRPDVVVGLVLCNPLTEATFAAGRLGPLHRIDRWVRPVSQLGRRVSRRVRAPGAAARAAVRLQLGPRGRAAGLDRDRALLAPFRRSAQMPALVDVLDDLAAYGALDRDGAAIGVPICTVWGAHNRVLSPSAGARLDSTLCPATAEVLADCGHLLML